MGRQWLGVPLISYLVLPLNPQRKTSHLVVGFSYLLVFIFFSSSFFHPSFLLFLYILRIQPSFGLNSRVRTLLRALYSILPRRYTVKFSRFFVAVVAFFFCQSPPIRQSLRGIHQHSLKHLCATKTHLLLSVANLCWCILRYSFGVYSWWLPTSRTIVFVWFFWFILFEKNRRMARWKDEKEREEKIDVAAPTRFLVKSVFKASAWLLFSIFI